MIDNTGVVTDPEEGVAYKFVLNHVTLGNILYAIDKTQSDNKYIESTIKPAEGLDFYAEKADGGYKFYTTISGAKTYVYAKTVDNNGKISKYLGYSTEEGTVWTYKSDVNAWLTEINGVKYVVGTYGTYNTFCISEASYITPDNSGVSQFPAHLMIKEIAESLAPAEGPTIYTTPEDIINAAYELELGGALSAGHKYTLTGVITSIDTAWDASYGNITVTMVVGNMTDKPIQAFRLKGEGADALEVGDKITVTGDIIKYDNKTETGKVELNAGCTLDAVVKASSLPTTPAEIVDAAYALEKGGKLDGTYTLTGKITSVDTAWSDQYKNITVTIAVEGKEDKPIQAFRLKGEGAEGLAVGDTITVTGEIINYADSSEKGKVEFNSGCTVSNIVKAEGTTPETPDTPDVPAPHTHAWDGGKVTKEATCKEEGVKTYTCACGETKTEKIAKTTAHTYKDGVCSVCGAKDPNYVAPVVGEKYIVVADDTFTVVPKGTIDAASGSPTVGADGLSYVRYAYTTDRSDIAEEGCILLVAKKDIAAYVAGTVEAISVEYAEETSELVGQEVAVVLKADGTLSSLVKTGKTVEGELTITKSGDKFTAKIGDKVYVDGKAAGTLISTDADFAVLKMNTRNANVYSTHNSTRTSVLWTQGGVSKATMFDLGKMLNKAGVYNVADVATLYNDYLSTDRMYQKYYGYDFDGDGKLDRIVITEGFVGYIDSTNTSEDDKAGVYVRHYNTNGVCNHGLCGGTTYGDAYHVVTGSGVANANDFVMVSGNFKTNMVEITVLQANVKKLVEVDYANNKFKFDDGSVYGYATSSVADAYVWAPSLDVATRPVSGGTERRDNESMTEADWKELINQSVRFWTDGKYIVRVDEAPFVG